MIPPEILRKVDNLTMEAKWALHGGDTLKWMALTTTAVRLVTEEAEKAAA